MPINTLNNEHLLPWEKPLYVSLDHIEEETIKKILYLLCFDRWVDWYSSPLVNKLLNNTNPEQDSYVISEVSSANKHSRWYYDCTWVVLIGKNRKGKNISLLTHQDPKYLFCRFDAVDCQNRFQNDLQIAIEKFMIQAIPGTIDACIVWGNYVVWEVEFRGIDFDMKQNYIRSITLLNEMIVRNFWFSPVVVGPIFSRWFSDIFVDTKHRRIVQKRWKKEDFTYLEHTIFEWNQLESTIPELDSKSQVKFIYSWDTIPF